mmetsp:Transcript_7493/g.9765  ORF Transcript_7493/g.9765 Transcript_7493/m.9765 type:complete len:93 (-) Transcript_7493:199-477(-)
MHRCFLRIDHRIILLLKNLQKKEQVPGFRTDDDDDDDEYGELRIDTSSRENSRSSIPIPTNNSGIPNCYSRKSPRNSYENCRRSSNCFKVRR